MRMSSRIYETIASKHNTYDDDLLQVPICQQQVKVEPWLFVTAEIWRRCFHFDSLIVGHRFIISGRTAPLVFVTQFHRNKQIATSIICNIIDGCIFSFLTSLVLISVVITRTFSILKSVKTVNCWILPLKNVSKLEEKLLNSKFLQDRPHFTLTFVIYSVVVGKVPNMEEPAKIICK